MVQSANPASAVPSLGVVTHAVGHQPMPFQRCLQQIAAAGGEHILLLTSPAGPVIRADQPAAAAQFPNVLASDPDELRRVVADAGLRVSSLLAGRRAAVESEAAADESLAALSPYRDWALRLGCPALCLSAPPASGGAKRAELRRLAHLMDALAAGGQGRLTVSVDVHVSSLVESVDDCRVLVEDMAEPRAGLLLNIGHLTTAGQEGWRLVEEYPQRIHVVGWKDHSLAADRPVPVYSVELGTGDTPLERYVRAFLQTKATPVHLVNVEHPPQGDEVPTLRRSVDYLRQVWRRLAGAASHATV